MRYQPVGRWLLLLGLVAVGPRALADDPPVLDHQPVPCTIPGKPISICTGASDDVQVAKVRIFFQKAGDKYYSYVDMVFGGINYCGTLPAPIEGKIRELDYYIQAIDNQYQASLTSTYRIAVQPESICKFPAVETDPARLRSIVVYAGDRKQGKSLPKGFDSTNVTFVPAAH